MASFERLRDRLSLGVLERAWRHVGRRGARRPDLERLLADVLAGRYRPGRPWRREMPKSGGGVRRLAVPRLPDRVLQRAVLESLPSPVRWVRPEVHGYVRGRSPQTATASLVEQVGARGWLEVVQIDVAQLFDALEHRRLREVLQRRWPDPLFVELCLAWAEVYGERGRGIGQGSPISPLVANLYLDHYLDPTAAMAADAGWVRYGDDLTAVTARPGGALVVFAALELALHAAGLGVAFHKVTVCVAPEGRAIRVLGRKLWLSEGADGWRLVREPVRSGATGWRSGVG